MLSNMNDREFLYKLFGGKVCGKYVEGEKVITVDIYDEDYDSHLGITEEMIIDCKNKAILEVRKYDLSDNTYQLSNGYWYSAKNIVISK